MSSYLPYLISTLGGLIAGLLMAVYLSTRDSRPPAVVVTYEPDGRYLAAVIHPGPWAAFGGTKAEALGNLDRLIRQEIGQPIEATTLTGKLDDWRALEASVAKILTPEYLKSLEAKDK